MNSGGTMVSASMSGFLFRSAPKGMICLSAMGTKEDEIFVAVGGESFDGMAMEIGRGSFI